MGRVKPIVIEAYFAFCSPKNENTLEDSILERNIYTVTFDGAICSSSTPKLTTGTPLKLTLQEDNSNITYGFLKNRPEPQAIIYLKEGSLFSICENIKDGTIKYVRLFGDELFRGNASISRVIFSSFIDEQEPY